jgi:hypothetical protein
LIDADASLVLDAAKIDTTLRENYAPVTDDDNLTFTSGNISANAR